MTQQKTKLVTKEDWADYWKRNAELEDKMKNVNMGYIDLTDLEFKNSIADLSKKQLEVLLIAMRSTMKFYKKILQEPYYTEHPEKKNTHRYEDSLRKATSINSKGKIVHTLINQ